eukprot:g10691.t1
MGPEASLRGHNMGADFNHPSGWSMYHGKSIPGFPRHPHRGFETITVTRRGSKMVEPSFKMFWAEDLPSLKDTSGPEVVLIAGHLPGFNAPPAPPPDSYASEKSSDVLVVTLKIPLGSSWTLPAFTGTDSELQINRENVSPPEKTPNEPKPVDLSGDVKGLSRNAYIHTGQQSKVADQVISGQKRLKLRPDMDTSFAPVDAPMEVLILQGSDIGEPVVQHGPFVGNSREDIAKAFKDYQESEFGGWPWPSDALAHERSQQRFALYSDGRKEEKPMP